MDFNWSNRGFQITALKFIFGLCAMSWACGATVAGETDAIGFISVGVSDKPMPSILITTKSEAFASQNEWFKKHQSPRFVLIKLKTDEIKLIGEMLKSRWTEKDVGRPAGAYIASRWEAGVSTEYILTPVEAIAVLKKISKLEIPENARTILEQALGRAELAPKSLPKAPGSIPNN